MSEGRAAMIRRTIEALNRGDIPGAVAETAADFVFDFTRSRSPERGIYSRDQVVHLQREFADVWESVRWELGELIETDEGIVTPVRTFNRGRDGIEVQTNAAWLWHFRDRLIERVVFFQDRRDALSAAGISE
jgi:ketosteroid isomerase-like protein